MKSIEQFTGTLTPSDINKIRGGQLRITQKQKIIVDGVQITIIARDFKGKVVVRTREKVLN